MLPYFTVFDVLSYKVDGYNVTLIGTGHPADLEVRCRERSEEN